MRPSAALLTLSSVLRAILNWTPILIVAAPVMGFPAVAEAQCADPNSARPILFVHGIWEGSSAWGTDYNQLKPGLRDYVISQLASENSNYHNSANYDLYFDGTDVRRSMADSPSDTDPVANAISIPCDARFFSIRFSAWTNSPSFDSNAVANISVITKAYELSQVIKGITNLTFVKDVIVIAHSLGALSTRAYVERLASSNAPCTSSPCAILGSQLTYEHDIAHIITVDGANAGTGIGGEVLGAFRPSLNVTELHESGVLVQALSYDDSYDTVNADPIPSELGIDAIISSFSGQQSVVCTLDDSPSCGADGIRATTRLPSPGRLVGLAEV